MSFPAHNWIYSDAETHGWWAGEIRITNHRFLSLTDVERHDTTYNELVRWIYEHIESPEYNVCWKNVGNRIIVKFKNDEDYIMALLRWK